jgi:hypothetical protein
MTKLEVMNRMVVPSGGDFAVTVLATLDAPVGMFSTKN